MSEKLRLLLVEDIEAQIKVWQSAVEMLNAEPEKLGFEIEIVIANSAVAATELLEARDFDGAVVDLRLGAAHNDDGNKIVRIIAGKEMTVTAVYTGQPSEVENLPESPGVKLFVKGTDSIESVIDWFKQQSGLIFQMRKVNSAIKNELAKIFHASIWPRWKEWASDFPQDELHTAVTRHFVSHLHAELLIRTDGAVHPVEWFFVPPVHSDRLSTGDLIKAGEHDAEIVVTPRCDLANEGKVETIQLAYCECIAGYWNELVKKANDGKKDAENERLRHFRQNLKNPLHFLPEIVHRNVRCGPWLVHFENVRTVKRSDDSLRELKERRIASLTPEFLPSLVERLGNYFSRIGSPGTS